MISIDQRKSLALEASNREVSPQSLVNDRFPEATPRDRTLIGHEVEWDMFAQTIQRPGDVMEACYVGPTYEEAQASEKARAAARAA